MKKAIDIEKLVQWALRDELPKGQAVAASAWQIIEQYAALGTRIQTGGYRGDGLGFTPGAPHDDALVVADAVKALPREWKFATSFDAREAFGEFLPIAGDTVGAAMMARFDPRSLVISMARQGRRPSWRFDSPTPRQVMTSFHDAQGALRERPLVHGIDGAGDLVSILPKRTKTARGVYDLTMFPRSPLDWCEPAPLQVAECRGEYIAYHRALCDLACELDGSLAEHDVRPPTIPAKPWVTGEPAPSRVIVGRDLSRSNHTAGMALGPMAEA